MSIQTYALYLEFIYNDELFNLISDCYKYRETKDFSNSLINHMKKYKVSLPQLELSLQLELKRRNLQEKGMKYDYDIRYNKKKYSIFFYEFFIHYYHTRLNIKLIIHALINSF